jgi:O-antigen ligase
MEMLVPFPLVMGMNSRYGRSSRAFFLFIAVIMSSSIFLSLSLGGMIAFAVELGVFSLIMLKDRHSAYREILPLGILCAALIVWLLWLRPAGLVDRLARLLNPIADAGATGRIAIVKDSLKMLRDRPLLGWGLGTFPVAYPAYRSFFTNFWVNEAHNDFVQTLVETGIVGFVFALFFLRLLIREGIRHWKLWRNDIHSGIALAAFLGCIGILVHSLFDFNLQIPANAAFFFALAALVTARIGNSGRELQTRDGRGIGR